VVPQDDVERRVQPKRNVKKPTYYRDLDDHVIIKRTRPIDSSDTGEEDTVHKRMREDKVEYSPSGGGDNEEENNKDDEDKARRSTVPVAVTTRRSTTMTRTSWRAVSLTHAFCRCLCFQHLVLNPSTPTNADHLHLNDRQYQSVGFYKAEKQLIDRYEEVAGGIKADISPDPLPLPQEMKKKNRRRITRAGLLAIIHCDCKMGNLTQAKMGMQLHSPLTCTKMRLILVSLKTSNSCLGKCLTTLQTVPWVKIRF
jgi:hypothetical protein